VTGSNYKEERYTEIVLSLSLFFFFFLCFIFASRRCLFFLDSCPSLFIYIHITHHGERGRIIIDNVGSTTTRTNTNAKETVSVALHVAGKKRGRQISNFE
tara:strand:- start:1 stop:300 length:300 start_codon:yes stop_codon:yes gene_type:complete